MANVTIRNVEKHYGASHAIRGVSVDIADGEFVTLVGPSGCGKSTLLRMIAGLEEISDGDVIIGDKVVNDLPPRARDIAMVFQSYALYPHMTVGENMGFSLKIAGIKKAEIKLKVARASQILALDSLLDRYPRQLSGEQRQRVAMGRAIVRDPQVFLFDEPLSNLDAKLRVQMRSEIKELHQRLKTTTIYVTHDQIEAMTMADRIVVMRDGVIEQVGPPVDLYDRPCNTFVATFIGSPSMNLLKGSVEPDGFHTQSGSLLPMPVLAAETDMARVAFYGMRPEHLRLDEAGFPVVVNVIEPTGSETHVLARIGEQALVGVFRERITLAPGETVRISPDLSSVHLFDAEGERLN